MAEVTNYFFLIAILFFPVIILFSLYHFYFFIFKAVTFSSKISAILTFFILISFFASSIILPNQNHIFIFSISSWHFYIHPIGFILPLLVSCFLFKKIKIKWLFLIISLIPVSFISYLMTNPVLGKGIVSPFPLWLFPPFMAALIAMLNRDFLQDRTCLYAFFLGTFGVIIGADFAHLPTLIQLSPTASMNATFGGAGSLDLIFLSSIFSVLFTKFLLLINIFFQFDKKKMVEYLHM